MAVDRMLLREEIYDQLRERIVRGDLRSGEVLRARALAEEMGVSRTPVREALRRLEDEGLVETAASRWTRVAAVDLLGAGRMYPILAALERLAVSERSFAGGELGALRQANRELAFAIEGHDAHAAYLADRKFHDVLVGHAANDELDTIVAELRDKTRILEHAVFFAAVPSSVDEHDEIIRRLEAGDLAGAGEAIERNHRQGLARLSATLGAGAGQPDAEPGATNSHLS